MGETILVGTIGKDGLSKELSRLSNFSIFSNTVISIGLSKAVGVLGTDSGLALAKSDGLPK